VLMQKHNIIKALFFLGIFSMFLLHQVLPHWHHQQEVGHSHENLVHNDGHDHGSSHESKSKKGFLDLFLDFHEHTLVSNEILLTHQSIKKPTRVKKEISTPFSVVHTNSSINYDEAKKIKVYHPPNNYFNSHLSSLDSRGPPSLG
jgi:hypothetical protein